jgi:hypothetical protein
MQERNKSHFGICSMIDAEMENIFILRNITTKTRNYEAVDLVHIKKAQYFTCCHKIFIFQIFWVIRRFSLVDGRKCCRNMSILQMEELWSSETLRSTYVRYDILTQETTISVLRTSLTIVYQSSQSLPLPCSVPESYTSELYMKTIPEDLIQVYCSFYGLTIS